MMDVYQTRGLLRFVIVTMVAVMEISSGFLATGVRLVPFYDIKSSIVY